MILYHKIKNVISKITQNAKLGRDQSWSQIAHPAPSLDNIDLNIALYSESRRSAMLLMVVAGLWLCKCPGIGGDGFNLLTTLPTAEF